MMSLRRLWGKAVATGSRDGWHVRVAASVQVRGNIGTSARLCTIFPMQRPLDAHEATSGSPLKGLHSSAQVEGI